MRDPVEEKSAAQRATLNFDNRLALACKEEKRVRRQSRSGRSRGSRASIWHPASMNMNFERESFTKCSAIQ